MTFFSRHREMQALNDSERIFAVQLQPHCVMNEFTENPNPLNAPPAADPFASAKASAMKAAEELRTAATAKVQGLRHAAEERASQLRSTAEEKAVEIKEYADKALTGARTQAKDFAAEAEKFAREKPVQALLTAFGLGLVVGVILRK